MKQIIFSILFALVAVTGREIGELFYQYVYLINKRSRREVRNILFIAP